MTDTLIVALCFLVAGLVGLILGRLSAQERKLADRRNESVVTRSQLEDMFKPRRHNIRNRLGQFTKAES